MNKSLKFKITIPVIGIVFLLLVVMVLTSLFISSRQIGRIAEEKGRAICVIQSEGLLALLTFEDKDGIKTSLKSLTKDPAIVHAQVLNPKGEVLGEVGEKLAQAKGENPREDLLVKKIDIGKRTCQLFRYRIRDTDKKEIGTLVLAMSLETLSAANRAITLSLLIIGLIALVVVGLVLMVLVNRVIKPLIDTSRLMEELASGEGDLTRRLDVQTTDEIGKLSESFNNFVEKIRQIIVKVKESADAVFTSTGEITSSSEDLATRTNEQAASITETSTTLEQFTSIVRQNSQNSEEVSTALKTFNEEIQTKKSLMDNVTSTMKEIDDSSKKIDNIINVINDISFQTNLLALNAAVEAARAGEAGRGFAVVASEVRNLAQKTAESSKTIQEIVTRNVASTKKGMDLVGETSAFFSTIVKVMEGTVNKIVLITQGSREQSTGIDQINSAIAQLEGVINQNATLVEELASAGKAMKHSTGEMHELVAQFKVEEE